MTVKLTHYFDTEEESGCCQILIWKHVNYFSIENQGDNSLWLQIWFIPGTKEYEKYKEMNGLFYCDYEPQEDELEIMNIN